LTEPNTQKVYEHFEIKTVCTSIEIIKELELNKVNTVGRY